MLIESPCFHGLGKLGWTGARERPLPSRRPAPGTKRSGSWSPRSDSARADLRCCKAAAQRRGPSESPRDQTDSALETIEPPFGFWQLLLEDGRAAPVRRSS